MGDEGITFRSDRPVYAQFYLFMISTTAPANQNVLWIDNTGGGVQVKACINGVWTAAGGSGGSSMAAAMAIALG